MDHSEQRKKDVEAILGSSHPRKVVLASPGTGKSYLFKEAIKRKRLEGKSNILAITFLGRLTDELADELAGSALVKTLHGFAMDFVMDALPEWHYYPNIFEIIKEDLEVRKIKDPKIAGESYYQLTKHYKTVGHDDVIYYAVKKSKKDPSLIPKFDLILIDEFQDFNETEAAFIDLLATKNEILVVGDDDQALYSFRGTYSKFIREKYDPANTNFESHTLKYCTRCTEIIIQTFHDVVDYYSSKNKLAGRIKKEYISFPPDKQEDSNNNPAIILKENVPPGSIASKIKYSLSELLKSQKIKSVLVIGEGRTCKSSLAMIARQLREYGFRNVSHSIDGKKVFDVDEKILYAYHLLRKNKENNLGWRILLSEKPKAVRKKILRQVLVDGKIILDTLPETFKKKHLENVAILDRIVEKTTSARDAIAESSVEQLMKTLVKKEVPRKKIFMDQMVESKNHLPRPLVNLDITVCNILGSKGLGADVVFLIGFDNGKLPMKKEILDSEIFQFLVAITRVKKRLFFVNTIDTPPSQFLEAVKTDFIIRED